MWQHKTASTAIVSGKFLKIIAFYRIIWYYIYALRGNGEAIVDLYYRDEYLATWDLTSGNGKIKQILLALAETRGATNSKNEEFHFVESYILSSPRNINDAIASGTVVMDLCMDQPASDFKIKTPHDRGPHIRIPIRKLESLFKNVDRIM